MINTKECNKCKQELPLDSFHLDQKGIGGRRKRCKACRSQKRFKAQAAKVLIFDIETAPLQAYVWGIWKQNIGTSMLKSEWFMLTWSAKWLFSDKIMSGRLTAAEALEEDDSRITRKIWELLDEADIIIAHNANKFDIKKLNTRFLMNGLNPPSPYQVIDTLDHARKRFAMTSNRLDYINHLLGIERKMSTGGFQLWKDCLNGKNKGLKKMEAYNKVDVKILEETYLALRAWIKPHPNMGLFILDDVDRCPTCGGDELEWGGSDYHTGAYSYSSFRCKCGAVGRSKSNNGKSSSTRSLNR